MESVMKQIEKKIPRPRILLGSVVAVTAIFYSTISFAVGTEEQRAACTPDVFRLCASQIPNVDAIVACLKTNKKNLSAGCQAVFNAPQERTATRSLATPEAEWCAFAKGPRDSIQQDWLKWCGSAAHQP
ncbi:MAG TPA: hypothetical protein VNZ48_04680 [Xanthobacteraceae bacterium]|jgi:hypothetical protein|nr:hypothetical protein [Xanthobacteraceae bacterium]